MNYKSLTMAQEDAIASSVIGGHKHWKEVLIDIYTGEATVTSQTGMKIKVTREGEIMEVK